MKKELLIKVLKYLSNHKVIFGISGAIIVTGSTIISPIILQKVEDNSGNYLAFDNKFFANEESLANYINKEKTVDQFIASQTGYILNDKYFNSISDVTKYLDEQYPITSLNTLHDPTNYMLSGDGNLSNSVITDINDQITTVYGTINNTVTFDENQAIASYAKANSSTEYRVLTTTYKTFEAAKAQYINGIKNDLSLGKSNTYTVYNRNGLSYTEEEIKKMLRNEMERGFEYQGNIFYEGDYNKFKTYFADQVSEEFLENNIKTIKNPNMRSYWVQVGKIPPKDYFSSPKYIEVNDELPLVPKFTETSSSSVNALFAGLPALASAGLMALSGGSTVDDIVSNMIEAVRLLSIYSGWNTNIFSKQVQKIWQKYHITKAEDAKERTLEIILSELKDNDIIGVQEFNDFMDLYNQYTNVDVKSKVLENLDKIQDKEFPAFNKLLVAFKRLNSFLKIYSTNNISPDFHLKLIEALRKVIVSYIHHNSGEMLKGVSPDSLYMFDDLSFEELYDYFISPVSFGNHAVNSGMKQFYNGMLAVQKFIDKTLSKVVPVLNKISESSATYLNTKQDMEDNANNINSLDKVEEKVIDAGDKALVEIVDKGINILEELHLDKVISGIGAGLKAVPAFQLFAKIWQIGDILSFSDVVNLEYNLDDQQKMEYTTMVYKIPFIKIRITQPKQPDVQIIKLTDSDLKFMTGVQSDENAIYEVAGKRYLNYRYAKEALLQEIYLHPQRYLNSKQVLRNKSFANRRAWNLFNGQNVKVGNGTKGTITQKAYDALYEAEVNQFAQTLFEEKYKNDANREINLYLDGFGNAFKSQQEAMNSIDKHAKDKSNYDIKYTYKTRNDLVQYFNSEEEREKFIYENEKVDRKEVVKSELISHNSFSELPEYKGESYKIFKVNFYGQNKYFYSEKLARDFIYNNVVPKTITFDKPFVQYSFKNLSFGSQELFNNWVKANTTILNNGQVGGRPIINIKKEDEPNA